MEHIEETMERKQSSLLDKTIRNQAEPLVRDIFGCCSRYRDCSNAQACLIPQLDYAKDCIYRKSLESGHIFCGKNADSFQKEIYQGFIKQLQKLSEKEKEVLTFILHYFFIQKAGLQRLALSTIPELSKLEATGFIQREFFRNIIIHSSASRPILDACGERIYEANEWAKQKCDPEKWKKRKNISQGLKDVKIYRKELDNWLVHFGHEIADALSDGIYFVVLNPNTQLELYEFFLDYLYQENPNWIISNSKYDSRFMKPSCMTEIEYRGRTYEIWKLAGGNT